MQQSEYIDHISALNDADPKHDEMPALAPVSGNMESSDGVADVRSLSDPYDGGAGAQSFQCG